MDFSDNYDNVLHQLNVKLNTKKVKHNINKNTPLLPFQSREPERVIFENGFYRVLGEFARIELDKKWDKDLDIERLFNDIKEDSNEVEVGDGIEEYLKKIIKEYLFNEKDELIILNPFLFLYIPLSNNKRAKGQHEIALFFRDIFAKDNDKLRNFFKNKDTNHTFIKFILNYIPNLPNEETNVKYVKKFNNIVNLFNEDINFIIDYEDFLIENINKIFAYYYFFYVSQLILILSKDFDGKNNEIDDLYFLLDWEKASKNRKTINKGYK
ncbi:MAG: DNA phosphorothioation-dependent restriction protein DptG, partial [Methanobrevibacter wolinii]